MRQKVNAARRRHFLDALELVILELELVAYVDAEGQQGDGDLGDDASVSVLDIGLVAADVEDGAEHWYLLV